MMTRTLITAAAALLATVTASYATAPTIQIQATYSSSATETSGTSNYAPSVTIIGLGSPFTQNLTYQQQTGQTQFISVNPKSGGSGVGTIMGTVSTTFTFTEPTGSITGVTTTPGAATATAISGGSFTIKANYELFYSNQTDCLVWSTATTCTATGNTTTISDVAAVTFSDGAVINVNLYNWSDWNMTPGISFTYVKQPTNSVPEPASIAVLGAGLVGLASVARRRKSAKTN